MILITKDRPYLSAGIASIFTEEQLELLLTVANLSIWPSSPMNEMRRLEVGRSVRINFPLQKSFEATQIAINRSKKKHIS